MLDDIANASGFLCEHAPAHKRTARVGDGCHRAIGAKTVKTKPGLCLAWKREPLLARLNRCVGMLAIHGAITELERHNIRVRLMKLKAKMEKQS
jgi:hypothetical protein